MPDRTMNAPTKVNLFCRPYKVYAWFLGRLKKNDHELEEFYYVRTVNEIWVRQRVRYTYGNNCGDCKISTLKTDQDSSMLWNHPYQTRAILPEGTKILDAPEEVLLEVSPGLGKAWLR